MLALGASVSAHSDKMKIYQSEKLTADPQRLLKCFAELQDVLEKHPKRKSLSMSLLDLQLTYFCTTEDLYNEGNGYHCGNRYWQVGNVLNNKWKNRDVVKRCADDLQRAAKEGRHWIQCEIKSGRTRKVAGWSPPGLRQCAWDNHEPCCGGDCGM